MNRELKEKMEEVKKRVLYMDSYSGPFYYQDAGLVNIDMGWGYLLSDTLDTIEEGNVLEVGCGFGNVVGRLKTKYPHLNIFGLRYTNSDESNNIAAGDVMEMKEMFPGMEFKVIFCYNSLLHFPEKIEALEIFRDSLEDDGKAMTDMNKNHVVFINDRGDVRGMFDIRPFRNVEFYAPGEYRNDQKYNSHYMVVFSKDADFGEHELVELDLHDEMERPENTSIYRIRQP